ncbi:MAG: hypothetical protein ACFCUQ_17175 [Kiloniellales bacterium]
MLSAARSAAVASGSYVIEDFRAEDASAIAAGFKTVYGDHYLSDRVYDPSYFVTANQDGSLRSFVARDEDGRLVAHLALLRSAPYAGLFEIAQGIVLPEHRRYGLLTSMTDYLIRTAESYPNCCGVFGTALTNHIISQRALHRSDFRDIGFEIDYVPARMFDREQSSDGAVATLVQYRVIRSDPSLAAYLPAPYAGVLAGLFKRLGEERQYRTPRGRMPWVKLSRTTTTDLPRFDMTRLLVRKAAADLEDKVAKLEEEARASGRRMLQVVLNLGEPACGPAVTLLRRQGFWLGGLLPRWLDNDGLLMQKSLDVPNFPAIRVELPETQALLKSIIADAEAVGSKLPKAA